MGALFTDSPSGVNPNFRCQVGNAQRGRVQARQLAQRDLFQGTADGRIHPLPCVADAALTFDTALTRGAAAFSDRDGTLEYVENLRRRDVLGTSRQPIAALRAA